MEASQVRLGVLEATLISDPIAPVLARGGRGHVHSVFASVVNLELGGRLVTVTGPALDPLPNGVRVGRPIDFQRSGIRSGMRVTVDGQRVVLPEAGLTIECPGAAAWSPRLARAERDVSGAGAQGCWRSRALHVRALAAARVARRRDAEAGFGVLLAHLEGTPLPVVAALAAPRLAGLSAALRDGDAARASEAADHLVGLGPGLTPSGDDALVGVAAAIEALAGPADGRLSFLGPPAAGAPARTTAVAATFLRHAAAGEFAGGIHVLVGALLGSDPEVGPAIDRVLGWGATSGTDTLVGILTGLDAVAGVIAPADAESLATWAAARRAA